MNVRLYFLSLLTAIVLIQGCGAGPEGSEQAARSYLTNEFDKWVAEQPNKVTTMDSRVNNLVNPLSYNIKSVVTDKPHISAFNRAEDRPEDWNSWPAYRCNVVIEWLSKAGTSTRHVTTYTLTWNAHERQWYVHERF